MPFVRNEPTMQPTRIDSRPEDEIERSFLDETLPAAFTFENSVGSFLARGEGLPDSANDIDHSFDFSQHIEGYESFAPLFYFANSVEEVEAQKRQIDREMENRKVLDDSGWSGVVAQLAAGAMDPINLIPVGGQAYRGYRFGGSLLNIGGRSLTVGAASTAVQELALHQTQDTRTALESTVAISVGALLSGVVGTGLGALKLKREVAQVNRNAKRAAAEPEAGTIDDTVRVGLGDLEKGLKEVLVDQGRGTLRDGLDNPRGVNSVYGDVRLRKSGDPVAPDGIDLEFNSGLVKVVWRHGEKSQESPQFQVTHQDLIDMPTLFRRYAPDHQVDDTGAPKWVWKIDRDTGHGVQRIEYTVKRLTNDDGHEHLVTVLLPRKKNPGPASPRRTFKEHVFGRTHPAADSPAEARDTAGIPPKDVPISQRGGQQPDVHDPNIGVLRDHDNPDPFYHEALSLEARVRDDLTVPRDNDPDILEEGSVKQSSEQLARDAGEEGGTDAFEDDPKGSVGAAAVNDTTLAEEGIKSALGMDKAVKFQDPLLRSVSSQSIETRRVAQELAESPLTYEKNTRGIPTAPGGSVETRVKMWNAPLAEAMTFMDDQFIQYRKGRSKRFADIPLTAARDLFGTQELTYTQFKQAVGHAMRNGDSHEIPEVAKAAQEWRSKLFDPLKDKAIEHELLPEDVGVETATSYLSRLYNHEKIIAQRPQFKRIVTDWLVQRQETQRAIQEDLAPLLELEDFLKKQEKNADGRLSSADRRLSKSEAKLEEAQREFQALVSRSFDLDEKGASNAKISELSTRITALRNRVNDLHDQTSGNAHKRDALSGLLEDLKARHGATIEDIAHALQEWPGKTGEGEKAVLKAAKRAANKGTDLERQELDDISDQIIDRILGTPDGRLPYDTASDAGGAGRTDNKLRGPMKGRSFTIPDSMIEDYLESDIEIIGRIYTRTMAPDVELTAKFGDVEMTDQISDIAREFNQKIDRPNADAKKLQKQKDQAIEDISAMRDRIRGTYALPSNPDGLVSRSARVLKNWNYLRLLGGMTVSAFPDVFRTTMVHGMTRTFRDGLVPLATNLRNYRLAADEVKIAGTAHDMVLDSRTQTIADVIDDYGRHSKFERGLHGLTNSFGLVSLMAPWNAFWKQFSGVVTMTRILDASGMDNIPAKELEKLAASGIDREMARRISAQFKEFGEINGSVKLANTQSWTDRVAAEALRAAVVRDVDRIIVTPGQDKPLWMSKELGSVVGQFRSFQMASTQRVMLAALQDRDMAVLSGAVLSVGAGMASYAFKSWDAGREVSDDPAKLILEGVDRSGLTGWFFEANNISEKFSRGTVGLSALTGQEPMSRFASRNIAGSVLGPSFGTLQTAAGVTGSAFAGDWQKSDTRALRRLLPYQNLFLFRQALDEVQNGIDEHFGVRK